ncbi:hypothetical protein [Oceaniglobus trochenteri]|uniref:hypothetical protein n=1 Tax=Oceaniglobus trochenteri TaxID=2763260 RepID=UPI001CFFBED6|nr:hypothetical protein [Oceaniglobus trochenteri]
MIGTIKDTLLAAAVAAAVAAAGWGWWQSIRADRAEARAASLSLQLGAAHARLANIEEDRKSDAEIDKLSDDDLRVVPDGWLLPGPGSGGLY